MPDYKQGSEGSKIRSDNPCKYDKVSRTLETPTETDVPYAPVDLVKNEVRDGDVDLIRRKNSARRDRRTGYKVTDNTVYPTPEPNE